jgi:hypothetical protein
VIVVPLPSPSVEAESAVAMTVMSVVSVVVVPVIYLNTSVLKPNILQVGVLINASPE